MTFKDILTLKADCYEEIMPDIKEHIEYIKEQLVEFYKERCYTIELIKPRSNMAIGNSGKNPICHIFIPRLASPDHYRQLFTIELEKLGFTENDIEYKTTELDFYESYSIILRW